MKRFIALVMAVILLMTLTSCGNENEKAEKDCWYCGEGVTEDAAFCSHCGVALRGKHSVAGSTSTNTILSDLDKATSSAATSVTSRLSTTTTSARTSSTSKDSLNKDEFNKILKIYSTYIEVNSADGVDVHLTWENKSAKEIKYIYFRVELYNRVNDLLECDISGKTSTYLKETGPIPYGKGNYYRNFDDPDVVHKHFIPGNFSKSEWLNDKDNDWAEGYWGNIWYNSEAYYVKITGVEIEYMDGTSYTMYNKKFFDSLGIVNLTIKDSIDDY